ncbi:hypothetical protein KGD82_07485 [Nocardiopsis eucommiae]|uniref:Carrier domain-containing protein n=1 Tax=Nocardiopsis eucommiae TaxID=2831970 RepID=A0A975QLF9_9ACTN|nr:hypothetical protein KGD82_07485 [Nocardiopsis eucommiae]
MEREPLPQGERSTTEEYVEHIWNEVLGVSSEKADSTFFELGGQSISAMAIVSRIEEELGLEADLGDLFEDPDVRTFARIVSAKTVVPSRNDLPN